MEDDTRFIDGIYNYCDRWCERCCFTDRCRLFEREQAQRDQHILRGEDPDDPRIAMQDVAESMRMLQEIAEERGVDLEADPLPDGTLSDDALGTAKLAHECLGKAVASLWSVGEFSRDWQGDTLPLAFEAEALRTAIDAAFPGHREFCRPGLDVRLS